MVRQAVVRQAVVRQAVVRQAVAEETRFGDGAICALHLDPNSNGERPNQIRSKDCRRCCC